MMLVETLLAPRVIMVLGLFTLLAGLEPFLEQWLNDRFKHNRPFHWFWDALLYPLLRAMLITGFVIALYPTLFGLVEAPGIPQLFAEGHARLNGLLGVVFLFTLALPAIPVISDDPAFVLPLQGMLVTAILFGWLTDYLHASAASIWPGGMPVLTLIVLAYFAHRLAQIVSSHFGEAIDQAWNVAGSNIALQRAIELLAQGPIVLLYGYSLGRQIAI